MKPRDRLDPRNIEMMDPEMVPILQAMTPAQRLKSLGSMWRQGLAIARGGVKHQHPDWDDARVRQEVIKRMSGGYTIAHNQARSKP